MGNMSTRGREVGSHEKNIPPPGGMSRDTYISRGCDNDGPRTMGACCQKCG
jgi:hypothetical protein